MADNVDEDLVDALVKKCITDDGSALLTFYWSVLNTLVRDHRIPIRVANREILQQDGLVDASGRVTELGLLVERRACELVSFCTA